MNYRVIYSARFARNLARIVAHIRAENPANAASVKQRVHDKLASLADFPNLGRTGEEQGTREIMVQKTPCFVIYRVNEDAETVEILTVWHTAQNRQS